MSERPNSETQKQVTELLNRGAWLLQQGQVKEATALLERAYELDTGSVPILLNLGGAYILAGRHQDAIPLLEAALEAEPENPMIWINLGAAHLGNPILATSEQQKQAIRAFEKSLELDPAAPSVHYNLGLIFVHRGDNDLAQAAFRHALRVNPQDRDARYWLNRLEAAEGNGGRDE